MTQDFKDKIALVTGASRGIGKATAIALGRARAHVIVTARTIGGLEEVDDIIKQAGGSATIMPLDLRELDKIDTLGPQIYERFGRLDVFISNAAMLGTLSPLLHQNAKEWDRLITLNLTSNFRLIRTLDPVLRAAEAGRAVFLTSGVTKDNRAYWGPYSVSKAGLEALAGTYASECVDSPVRVNCFDPGPVRTAMRAQAYPGEDASKLKDPGETAERILELCRPDFTQNGERLAA